MPIETAPRDGTRVLVNSRYGVVIASQNVYGDWSRDLAYATDGDNGEEFYLECPAVVGITHWQPLTEPHT